MSCHTSVRVFLLVGLLFLRWSTAFLTAAPPTTAALTSSKLREQSSLRVVVQQGLHDDYSPLVLLSRKHVFSAIGSSLFLGGVALILVPSSAEAATTGVASISACTRPAAGSGASSNCVSTASVKQVDLFISPWTWRDGISVDEVVGRLKGAIASDATLSLEEQQQSAAAAAPDKSNRYYLRVRAARNFCMDEIEFVVNPADRVITFRSQQIEGPDNVSDFGANRKRLDELRKRTGVLDVMGAEFDSADSGPREGTVGQLKAFWGLQSGGGYESILLDDDDTR